MYFQRVEETKENVKLLKMKSIKSKNTKTIQDYILKDNI